MGAVIPSWLTLCPPLVFVFHLDTVAGCPWTSCHCCSFFKIPRVVQSQTIVPLLKMAPRYWDQQTIFYPHASLLHRNSHCYNKSLHWVYSLQEVYLVSMSANLLPGLTLWLCFGFPSPIGSKVGALLLISVACSFSAVSSPFYNSWYSSYLFLFRIYICSLLSA
jgi:hypothetical protein